MRRRLGWCREAGQQRGGEGLAGVEGKGAGRWAGQQWLCWSTGLGLPCGIQGRGGRIGEPGCQEWGGVQACGGWNIPMERIWAGGALQEAHRERGGGKPGRRWPAGHGLGRCSGEGPREAECVKGASACMEGGRAVAVVAGHRSQARYQRAGELPS